MGGEGTVLTYKIPPSYVIPSFNEEGRGRGM